MPQPYDLSLRHLPDVSDSSFSFQIPGAIRGDNLLADDDMNFFEGADDVSIAPLASPPTEPLGQQPTPTLKPKAEKLPSSKDGRKVGSFPTLSYDSKDHDTIPKQEKANPHEDITNVFPKARPKVVTTSSHTSQLPSCEGSPAAVRVDNLRVELNLFGDNLFAGPSKSEEPKGILKKSLERKVPIPRHNQKVIEGGITKTRCATKHPDGSDTLPIQQENPTIAEHVSNEDLSFADLSMSSAAGRLVMYSKKFVSSFGLHNSDKSLEVNNGREDFISQNPTDKPLTVSQLSPEKICDPSRDIVPMSPLRLPVKRPATVASNMLQKQRKKSKTDASSADVSVPKPNIVKARLPARKNQISNSELRRNDRSTKGKPTSTRVDGPGIKRSPVFKPVAIELEGGIATSASRLKNSKEKKDAEPANSTMLKNKSKGVASSSQASSSQRSSRAVYHTRDLATRPLPFNFQTSGRGPEIGDRHEGANDASERSESQSEKRYSTTIPDFRAMHAAQEAELALRKENIQPVVPLPVRWQTDYRLKERQKFDERVREKEREQERLLELRRKEKEEQEDREVRELRKKAVPKAHEVPEWYKEAPRKKKEKAID